MSNEELLLAISNLLEEKLEQKLDQKLDEKLDQRLKAFEERIDQKFQTELQPIKEEIHAIQVHLETVTDRNIAILAENHLNLVRKLNENAQITDTQFAYKIKVNHLTDEVEKLKKEMELIKNKIA